MALRDTLRNLIGIPENDYDNDYDDEMQSGNIDRPAWHPLPPTASTTRS